MIWVERRARRVGFREGLRDSRLSFSIFVLDNVPHRNAVYDCFTMSRGNVSFDVEHDIVFIAATSVLSFLPHGPSHPLRPLPASPRTDFQRSPPSLSSAKTMQTMIEAISLDKTASIGFQQTW